MTAPLEQNCSSPSLQNSHSPHESTMQPTPTRSPTWYFVTPSPTAETTPAISWPGTMGKMALPHSSRTWWMSLWQMPANLMSMRTSSSRRSRCSTVRGSKAAPALGATSAGVEITGVSPSRGLATLSGAASAVPRNIPGGTDPRTPRASTDAPDASEAWQQRRRDVAVGLRAARRAGRRQDRAAHGGGLGEPDRLGDRRVEHRQVVALPHVGEHLAGVVAAAVVERRQDPPDLQVAVEDALHVGDGVEQLPDAAVAQHLARHRDEQAVGGGERIEGEHAEARRAVEQHDVVGRREVLERRAQHVLAARSRHEGGLGTGEVDRRGHEVDALLARHDDVGERRATGQDVVDRLLDGVGVDAEGEGEAGLRVEVDEQDASSVLGERGAEARDRGGLGDATLLVRDGEDRRAARGLL